MQSLRRGMWQRATSESLASVQEHKGICRWCAPTAATRPPSHATGCLSHLSPTVSRFACTWQGFWIVPGSLGSLLVVPGSLLALPWLPGQRRARALAAHATCIIFRSLPSCHTSGNDAASPDHDPSGRAHTTLVLVYTHAPVQHVPTPSGTAQNGPQIHSTEALEHRSQVPLRSCVARESLKNAHPLLFHT